MVSLRWFVAVWAIVCSSIPSLSWAAESQAPLKIVTSFSIIDDIVRNIAPPESEVTCLVGCNSDPHAFEPSAYDAARLTHADVVIFNGLDFEPWLEKLITASNFSGTVLSLNPPHRLPAPTADERAVPRDPLFVLGESFEKKPSLSAPSTLSDPHVWHDVQNVMRFVETIAHCLCQKSPHQSGVIQHRAKAYQKKLIHLDHLLQQTFHFATQERTFTVATLHAGFDAFSARYGVRFISPLGLDTQAEPSARTLASIITMIRNGCVSGLFVENITNPRLIHQIADETGRTVDGILYSDALSDPTGPASTYIDLMLHNAQVILESHIKNSSGKQCPKKLSALFFP